MVLFTIRERFTLLIDVGALAKLSGSVGVSE